MGNSTVTTKEENKMTNQDKATAAKAQEILTNVMVTPAQRDRLEMVVDTVDAGFLVETKDAFAVELLHNALIEGAR